jgi:hypothetical protein
MKKKTNGQTKQEDILTDNERFSGKNVFTDNKNEFLFKTKNRIFNAEDSGQGSYSNRYNKLKRNYKNKESQKVQLE